MNSTIQTLSDTALLSVLVGDQTATTLLSGTGGSLALLLHEKAHAAYLKPHAAKKLQAARELVRRSLAEQIKHGDAMTSPQAVREYLQVTLRGLEHEVFVVVFLDARNRVIAMEELFRGTLTQTSVYPREVIKRALALNAAAVILAHNHPSGDGIPSRADELLTKRLRETLGYIDVRVLDHFIVAGPSVVSLAESGML